MRAFRIALRTLLLIPVLAAIPCEANAQSFFEELFGIGRAARPERPPADIPSAPSQGAPGGGGGQPSVARPSTPPPPRQPVVLKAPSEDGVIGEELQLNGLNGSLKLQRAGSGLTALVTLPGTKISQPTESCTVKLNAGAALALSSEGKPDGVSRYEAAGAECPLRFEILDGSVLAKPLGEGKSCAFTAADCLTTPGGLWGPGATGLIPRAAEFDTGRGVSDKAVRDNFKVMGQRMKGQDIRPVVQEQAAFSSDREEVCRTYAREGAHGFCHLRYTEARALSLAVRLGANLTQTTASVTTRPRRRSVPQPTEETTPEAAEAAAPPVD